jgi:diguanylate cyclase (GGDEF)-like protein
LPLRIKSPLLHEYGKTVTHFAAIERDVTALKLSEIAHRDAAQLDALTGLLNRRGFDALSEGALHALRASRLGYAVIAIDIDHFKRINDQYGHAAGDQVLRELAALIGTISRKADLCARFGGEEFVMLLPGVDEEEAMQVAERLRSRAAELRVGTDLLNFTLSAGIATDSLAQDLSGTLIASDAALYRAKASGRNCVQLFK